MQDRPSPSILEILKATFNIGRWALPLAVVAAGAVLLVLAFGGGSAPVSAPPLDGDPQHLVSILQYLESDYPAAIASNDSGELAEQRSLSAEALSMVRGTPRLASFEPRVVGIDTRVQRATDGPGVGTDCAALVDDLVAATGMARTPAAPPDLDEGARLFAQTCATCHGPTGHGDGIAAAALTPKPADFHAEAVMNGLTPFKAFNVIRFGVKGTAMAPFETLDEKQRWALAFYLFSLRQPACDHAPPRLPLDRLANASDPELAQASGARELACLRRKLPELDAPAFLAAARSRVEEAGRLASQGDAAGAEKAVLDAYLTDIEPRPSRRQARATPRPTRSSRRRSRRRGPPSSSGDPARATDDDVASSWLSSTAPPGPAGRRPSCRCSGFRCSSSCARGSRPPSSSRLCSRC